MLLRVKREKKKQAAKPGPQDQAELRAARKRHKELGRRRDEITATVETLEGRVHEINEVFCDPTYFDRTPHQEVTKLEKEQKDLSSRVDELMGEWERVEREIEELEEALG